MAYYTRLPVWRRQFDSAHPLKVEDFSSDEENTERTYQPDFLINDNKIIEIKNKWTSTLDETKIKSKSFKKKFPLMEYKILDDF